MSGVNLRGLAWHALGALVFAAASASCGFPSPEACELACGEANACPEGFECQAGTQLCVPAGSQASCSPRTVGTNPPGGSGPDADAGLGGVAGEVGGPGQGGASGSPGSGGAPLVGGASGGIGEGSGGDGGSGGPSSGELGILDLSASPVSCSGAELARRLRASGGVGPYTWRVLEAPAGVEPTELAADFLELTGIPTESGPLTVELEDADGTIARSSGLEVFEGPRIENPGLPPVCSGEAYEVQLLAAGGQANAYVWSTELEPGPGLPDTLDQLGLVINGSTLSGELERASEGLAPLRVALRVSDGVCSSSQLLELDVAPADDDACPSITIVDPPAIDALPSPCRGNRYSETLTVEGGEPPYRWTELSAPPGLSLSASGDEFATLAGVAVGDGLLQVEVTDASFRTIRKSYEVRARDKCWLAYVASEPSPARLELVDGRLLARQPDDARRRLPDAPSSDGVVDFAYSADGRLIAYRIGPDASALRLELLRLSDGSVRALELGGSVAAYAWSPDSATLAVAFRPGAQTRLGGVDVAALERAPATPGTPFGSPRVLGSQAVSSVDSELVWSDAGHVAFLSRQAGVASRRRLLIAVLGATGFQAPAAPGTSDFSDAARLLAGKAGVFVAEPETGLHVFFASDGRAPLTHSADLVVSPSGALTALARDGGLQLFRPSEPSGPTAPPFLGADGCTTLLAWASGRDRIACADERGGQNQVALFDAAPAANPGLTGLALMAEPYLYPLGEHGGRRRLLSPSGRWFAFVSDDDLYVAQTDERVTRLAATVPTPLLGTRPGALAFSPDERFLLVGAGNALGLLDLERAPSLPVVLSNSALINDSCSERFVDGASEWCGREPAPSELAWSSDAGLVAFRSSLGTLLVIDASLAASGVIGAPIAPDNVCSEACPSSLSARFQP
jgi:hypothetical protein